MQASPFHALPSTAPCASHGVELLTMLLLACGAAAQEWRPTWPTTGTDSASTFDLGRLRTVVFGGYGMGGAVSADTFEHDGAQWTRIATAVSPPARAYAALAYDIARGRTVLFGGAAQLGSTTFADTWEYDGSNWTRVLPPTSPPARWVHAMAYDVMRARTVLFGGSGVGGADTWEYDGRSWTQVLPASSPAARSGHAMTYDLGRARTVLFGGIDFTNATRSDTWEFDGANWT
jgi:hypothetical protein